MPFAFAGTMLLFCNICLRIWSIPIGMKFAAWFLMGFNSCMTPMIFPFVHLIMKDDNEAKSFTTGAMVSGLFVSRFILAVPLAKIAIY